MEMRGWLHQAGVQARCEQHHHLPPAGLVIMGATHHSTQAMVDREAAVAVVTDSVAQVPPEVSNELGITVIPLTVTIGAQSFRDGMDLALDEFYRRMRIEKITATTAAPTPMHYREAFEARLQAGAQAVLCLTLSGKLSSSYVHACLAAEQVRTAYPDQAVEVLDTRTVTVAEGFVVMAAARSAAEGKRLPEVLQAAEDACRRVMFVAALDTLEYLARGGRVGKAAYLLGSLIDIKPILTVDPGGMVVPLDKVRGNHHAMRSMVDHMARWAEGRKEVRLGVLEADAADRAAELEEMARQRIHPTQVIRSQLTPVMGAHAGPGVIGLAAIYE